MELDEQASDKERSERQPMPCRDGFSVAAAKKHSSDGSFSPYEGFPMFDAGRSSGETEKDCY